MMTKEEVYQLNKYLATNKGEGMRLSSKESGHYNILMDKYLTEKMESFEVIGNLMKKMDEIKEKIREEMSRPVHAK